MCTRKTHLSTQKLMSPLWILLELDIRNTQARETLICVMNISYHMLATSINWLDVVSNGCCFTNPILIVVKCAMVEFRQVYQIIYQVINITPEFLRTSMLRAVNHIGDAPSYVYLRVVVTLSQVIEV